MRRSTLEKWISRAIDGELSPRRIRRLERALASSSDLKLQQEAWSRQGEYLRRRAVPRGPTPEAAWADVQRSLRLEGASESVGGWASSLHSPLRWAVATMGILVACAAVVLVLKVATVEDAPTVARAEPADVEWVESDLPDAVTMVYQDPETGWTVIWVDAEEEGNGHVGS